MKLGEFPQIKTDPQIFQSTVVVTLHPNFVVIVDNNIENLSRIQAAIIEHGTGGAFRWNFWMASVLEEGLLGLLPKVLNVYSLNASGMAQKSRPPKICFRCNLDCLLGDDFCPFQRHFIRLFPLVLRLFC